MDEPLHILAISGSLRATSSNSAVLHAMSELAPERIRTTFYEQLTDLPYK